MKFGPITTGIVADGLVFNLDSVNRSSYVPGATTTYNTLDTSQSGSWEGAPTFQSTATGSYWNFDGIDDWIRVADSQFPSSRTAFTIEAWVKFTAFHIYFDNGIVSKWQTGASSNNEWILARKDQSGPSRFGFNIESPSNGAFKISGSADYAINTWYHLIGTFDGADNGVIKLYENGVLQPCIIETGEPITQTYSAQDVGIANFGTTFQWDGKQDISSIRYYNRALTLTEVLQNYNATKNRFP